MLVRDVLVELEPGERVPEPLAVVRDDAQEVAGDQRGMLGERVLCPAQVQDVVGEDDGGPIGESVVRDVRVIDVEGASDGVAVLPQIVPPVVGHGIERDEP